MNVAITFGSRAAIPVRALPFVASLMATPRNIAQGLAEQNEKSEFVAYWADAGEEIPLQQWRSICDAIEGLTAAFLDSGDSAEESRQVEIHESVSQLPAGAFVWADTFKHWLNTKCPGKDQVRKEQHLVTIDDEDPALPFQAQLSEHSINLAPTFPPSLQQVLMEGFEPGIYAEILTGNRIEVDDFLWLVGLNDLVDDGMYKITLDGVRASAEDWDLSAPGIKREERKEIKAFIEAARLDFPCTSQRLVEWANGINWDFELPIRFVRAVAEGASVAIQPIPKSGQQVAFNTTEKKREGRSKLANIALRQEEILTWLRGNGFDPLCLPSWRGNPTGAKAKVKEAMLKNARLFTPKTFENAWEGLAGRIKYKD